MYSIESTSPRRAEIFSRRLRLPPITNIDTSESSAKAAAKRVMICR
jgi:hypothetical protein